MPATKKKKMVPVLVRETRLCEDVCRHIVAYVQTRECARCGVVVETRRRNHTCFVRGRRLCFTCWHRARAPA